MLVHFNRRTQRINICDQSTDIFYVRGHVGLKFHPWGWLTKSCDLGRGRGGNTGQVNGWNLSTLGSMQWKRQRQGTHTHTHTLTPFSLCFFLQERQSLCLTHSVCYTEHLSLCPREMVERCRGDQGPLNFSPDPQLHKTSLKNSCLQFSLMERKGLRDTLQLRHPDSICCVGKLIIVSSINYLHKIFSDQYFYK